MENRTEEECKKGKVIRKKGRLGHARKRTRKTKRGRKEVNKLRCDNKTYFEDIGKLLAGCEQQTPMTTAGKSSVNERTEDSLYTSFPSNTSLSPHHQAQVKTPFPM